MFTILRETYRLLKKYASTYFVIFVLEIVVLALVLATAFLTIKFPQIRGSLENKFTAKVFFKENVNDAQVKEFLAELKKKENMKAELVEPEKAAKILSEKTGISRKSLINEIRLPLSVNIVFTGEISYSKVLVFLQKLKQNKLIDTVIYPKKIAYSISKHLLLFSVSLLLAVILIVWGLFLVIRQFSDKIIQMNNEENKIKALIGVRPFFIKTPFTFAKTLITLLAFCFIIGGFLMLIYITRNNIVFEKTIIFPIIITLIFSVMLVNNQNVSTT